MKSEMDKSAIEEIVEVNETESNRNNGDQELDAEMKQVIENDADVIRLKEQEAELMSLFADSKIMKAYRSIRRDIYGIGERRQVTQKEKKKKKAKRRMAKKSKR